MFPNDSKKRIDLAIDISRQTQIFGLIQSYNNHLLLCLEFLSKHIH